MIEENLPGGAYRKQVYAAVQQVIGRNLTENEHMYISNVLKAYGRSTQVITKTLVAQKPKVHKWTCKKCGDVKEVEGKNGNKPPKNP